MSRLNRIGYHWLCAAIIAIVAISGCNRKQRAPAAQSQAATGVQETNQPTTVKGCLRAGEAPDTYVLTGERTAPANQTATYQLQPAEGVALAEHIGKEVEVEGVIVAQQEITTQSSPQRAKPTGTGGTPTVSSTTELDIKKLTVRSVRPIDDHCRAD